MVDDRISRRRALSGIGATFGAGLLAMVGRDSGSDFSLVDDVHGELRPVVFQDADPGITVGSNGHLWEWINHPFRHNEKDITWYDGHGGVAESDGSLFLAQTSRFGSNKKPHHNVWVYGTKPDDNGQFELKSSFGNFHPIAPHGINVQKEDGKEFAYLAFSNGGFVVKTDLEGKEIWRAGKPDKESANYASNSRFAPTNVAFTREGHVLVSDGYGSGFTIEYDQDGKFIQDFGGRLKDRNDFTAGKFTTAHGVDVFDAGKYDVVTVADREKQRVQHFTRDIDGKFRYVNMSAKTGSIALNELESGLEPIGGLDQRDQMGNACNIRYSPDQRFAVVPELTSRITVYKVGSDGGLTNVVAHLGDGRPHKPNRGKPSNTWDYFVTPHYAGFHGNPGDIVTTQYTNGGAGSVLLRKIEKKA